LSFKESSEELFKLIQNAMQERRDLTCEEQEYFDKLFDRAMKDTE
jgi:hypothetical protein